MLLLLIQKPSNHDSPVFILLLDQEEEPKPLAGAVIYVSKKLSKRQRELNAVAASVGADYRYQPTQWLLSFCTDGNSNNFESLHPNTPFATAEH